ncbi:MAG: hypothetical protein ACI84C_000919 [Flavobacteriales bacterium]|jgi:hypothetical protein
MIPLFFGCLVAIAWVRVNYGRRIPQLFSDLINVRLMRQTMREELVLSHRASIAVSSIFVVQFSLLLYLWEVRSGVSIASGTGFNLFWKLVVLVVLVYFVKIMLLRIIQWVIEGDFSLNEYIHTIFLSNKVLGLLLFPLLLFSLFTDYQGSQFLLIVALASVGLMYVFRLFRGAGNALMQGIRPVYIILYLCTLEILPLLLFMKFIS